MKTNYCIHCQTKIISQKKKVCTSCENMLALGLTPGKLVLKDVEKEIKK